MVYQDHLSKIVQLRPLKTKRAEEVAYHVLAIFLTIGAPAILQSDNGREFSNQVISKTCAMWKDVKIVHGKPRHSQTQGSVKRANQDIQNMLTAWRNDSDTNKWTEGLPFVQFAKNTTYHEGKRQSVYEAIFGVKAKRGVASSFLPSEQIENIETEKQLKEIANAFETKEQLEETGNTSEKIGGHTENHIQKKNIQEVLQSTMSSHQVLTETDELISIKRPAAKDNLQLQATKMLRISKKQFPPAQIGDTVRMQVLDVDRGRTDNRNVLAVAVRIGDFYKL
ncbi:KRAB-A domain-containing protein 2-like [Stegodyphus dumicola]|uniref:KRAB-A domain-containing protein 2-like n=1 Tax=Stegodyphus dumicola TaxID=202533 RepID=UPI0015ACF51F|nr:KRAB-A domain-containing protein 2-like [Stegodyphus dumicola]